MDRGVDDLINESMMTLADERGYLQGAPSVQPPPVRPARSAQPVPRPAPAPVPRRPPPPLPVSAAPPPLPAPPPSRQLAVSTVDVRPLQEASYGIQEMDDLTPAMDADSMRPRPLFLLFQNDKYIVDKDEFVIGRGVKSSDLAIRDGNISRKHAVIVRQNGLYYMRDLGSTNGIEFDGIRVDNKRIEEGDLFSLCDYTLKFTYHQ
jgi:hypothetical protein